MIKTDKVIYRTRTQKEYDWLMKELEEAGCEWFRRFGICLPTEMNYWFGYGDKSYIKADEKQISYGNYDYVYDDLKGKDYEIIEVSELMNKEKLKPMNQSKDTAGKPKLSLVPPQVLFDIAEVREYGNAKYPSGGKDNWKNVDINDYKDALLRHTLKYIQDPKGKDEESGIEHYKHMACNIAFICELEKENG